MEKIDVTIIGAGVVGLAVAAEVAREDLDVYILEMEENGRLAFLITRKKNLWAQLVPLKHWRKK